MFILNTEIILLSLQVLLKIGKNHLVTDNCNVWIKNQKGCSTSFKSYSKI